MSMINFTGNYRAERHPYFERKSNSTKEMNRFFDYMQSKDVQGKIAKLPKNSLIYATNEQNKGEGSAKIMYVPYGDGEHELFESLSGTKGMDTFSLTTLKTTTEDINKRSFKRKVNDFLDGILSIYDKQKD